MNMRVGRKAALTLCSAWHAFLNNTPFILPPLGVLLIVLVAAFKISTQPVSLAIVDANEMLQGPFGPECGSSLAQVERGDVAGSLRAAQRRFLCVVVEE